MSLPKLSKRRSTKLINTHRIKPSNYSLSLYNLKFGGDWGYDGTVKIQSTVKSSTDEVVLNTKHLEITDVEVSEKEDGGTWTG